MLTADTATPAIACDEPASNPEQLGGRLVILDTPNTAFIQDQVGAWLRDQMQSNGTPEVGDAV